MFVHGAAEDSRVWQPQLAASAESSLSSPGTSRGRAAPLMCLRISPTGLRELPRGADRGARRRPGARCRPILGRHCREKLHSRHPELVDRLPAGAVEIDEQLLQRLRTGECEGASGPPDQR